MKANQDMKTYDRKKRNHLIVLLFYGDIIDILVRLASGKKHQYS